MKKYITLLLAMVLGMGVAMARPVDPVTAAKAAQRFMRSLTGTEVQLRDVTASTPFTGFYVFTTGDENFVMVAADDCATPIVGYSLSSSFHTEQMPAHVRSWMEGIGESVQAAKAKGQSPQVAAAWKALLGVQVAPEQPQKSVSPLITTTWNQAPYYNDLCPEDDNENEYYNYKVVAGCVATATAQIMKFWEHPATGYGSHSYTHATYGIQSADFGNTTYNWSKMPNALSSASSSAQVNAVATLMYHIGVADEMKYDLAANGGSGANNYNWDGALHTTSQTSLQAYFKYKPTMYAIGRDDMPADVYDAALMDEIDAGRPILYSGRSATGGHSFVVDGYDDWTYNCNMFHINWGWGGYNDGYFPMGGLEPSASGIGGNSESAYNLQNVALLGIEPNDDWGTGGTVSANSYGNGMVSGTGTYSFGDTVSLFAEADEGYRFAGWNNIGRFNPIEMLMNGGDITMDAYFEAINVTDTLSYCGTGHYLSGLGYGTAGSDVYWGIRLPASSLEAGKALTAVQFYAIGEGNYTVSVYTGSSLPSTPAFSTTIYASDQGWQTVVLDNAVSIASGNHIWIGIYNNEYAYPATMTYGSGNQDGFLWGTGFSFGGWNQYSFMIRGIIGADNSESVDCSTPLATLNEGFEGTLDCWTFIDADADGNGWYVSDDNVLFGTASLNSLSYDMYGSYAPLYPDNWVVSPAVTISDDNALLSWNAKAMCSGNYSADNYSVYVGTGDSVSNYTLVYSETMTEAEYDGVKHTVDLSDYIGQSVHIAFRHHDCYDMCGVVIDNVKLTDPVDQVDCSVALSTLDEDFSDELQCWTTIDSDGDGYNWKHAGGYMQSYSYNYGALTPDNWLVSPKVILPADSCFVGFDLQTSSGSYYAEHYGVYVGTGDSTYVLLYEETCGDYGEWHHVEVDLSKYAGQEVTLAFRHFDCTDQNYLLLDNVKVQQGAFSYVPPTQYTITFGGNGGYYYGNLGGNYVYSYYDDSVLTLNEGTECYFYFYSFTPSYSGYYSDYYDADHAELKGLTVNGVEVNLDELPYGDYSSSSGYKYYYLSFNLMSDMDVVATYGPCEEEKTYTVTVNNPDGGYIYYCERDADNNEVQCSRIYAGTFTADIPVGHRFCVDFGDINPNKQPSVNIDKQYAMVSSILRNGEPLALDGTDPDVEITDYFDDYGYRLYTICSYYTDDVTFDVSYSPYDDSKDKENATLTVINNGGGYLAYLNNGSQYRMYDTVYRTFAEGDKFTFTFGTFTPVVDWSYLIDESAMRLEHFYFDGVDMPLDTTLTPGLTIYNHNDEGYIFYNYIYTQDSVKHTIEFVFGPYSDSTNCEPVVELKVDNLTHESVSLSWLPAPSSTGDYLVVVSNGDSTWAYGNNIMLTGLAAETEYTVSIFSQCLNGGTATASITFTTYGAPDTLFVLTNGTQLWYENKGSGTSYFDNTYDGMLLTGYTGATQLFLAETYTAELAAKWGLNPATRMLEKLYFDGVEVPIDGSDSRVSISNLDGYEGLTQYRFTITYGDVHTVQTVFTGECPSIDGIGYSYGSDYAEIYWNVRDGVKYTVAVDDVADTNLYYGYYSFYNMQAGVEYSVTITALCTNGQTVDTTFSIKLPEMTTLTIINNGGGWIQSMDGSELLMYEDSTYSTYTYSGMDGDYYQLAAFSTPKDFANYAVAEHNAYRVKDIRYDGESVALDGSDSRVVLYKLVDGSGNTIEDAVAYVFYATLGEVGTVEVVFGGDELDSINCYSVANLHYGYDAENAYFSWGKPNTSSGSFEVYLDGELYATTSATWFDFYGLSQNTTYTVTIRALCLNGSYADTTVTFTTKTYAGYMLSNPDGGQVYTPQLGFSSDTEPVYIEGIEGEMTYVQLMGMTRDFAVAYDYNLAAYQVESIIVDGTEVPLDGSDSNLYIYDYLDEYGEIYYVYHFKLGEVDEIEVHFSGDEPDSVNCTAPDDFRVVEIGMGYADFEWTTPTSSNGEFSIVVTDELGDTLETYSGTCNPMGQHNSYWIYSLASGTTYTATLTSYCLNGSSVDTVITFTTEEWVTVSVTKNQNGLLSNPEWGGQMPVGTNTVSAQKGTSSYFMAVSFSAEAATEFGWSLKYRTLSEMKVDGIAVDIDDYVYDTLYSDAGNMYVRYLYWFTYGDFNSFEVSFTGDDVPSYDYTLKNNGGYMRFIDYGPMVQVNFESDTVVTVDSASTVAAVFFTYDPNHPYNEGISVGVGHEMLQTVYLDGESIALDGSDSRISISDNMNNSGYISYRLQHVADGPHTIEGVFSEWVAPEKVLFTFTNTGNGLMAYSVEDDEYIEVTGTAIDSIVKGKNVVVELLSIDPVKMADYIDLDDYDNTKLTAVYLDGESIALDGSDSRLEVIDYAIYDIDGLLVYNLYVESDADHSIEGVFGPWTEDTVVATPTYNITLTNTGMGYFGVGNSIVNGTMTATADSGINAYVVFATVDPSSELGQAMTTAGFTGYTLTDIKFDGVSVAIDGTDPSVEIYDYLAVDSLGYKMYVFSFSVTGNHTIEGVFGPWDSDTTIATHTFTVKNPDGGYMELIVNGNFVETIGEGTSTYTYPEGTTVCVLASTDSPSSDFYDIPDATQLNNLYVDGEEIPLDGSDPTLLIGDYLSTDGYILYQYCLSMDADHSIEASFGPWTGDSVMLPPTYTVTLTNTGKGYFEVGNSIVNGTMTATADSGIYASVVFATVNPSSELGQAMAIAGFTGYTLTDIKFDGMSVAIDGTDPSVEIYDYLAVDSLGYKIYVFSFYVTGNHTIEGIFGPWGSDTTSTVDTTYTFTLTNTGNGAMIYEYESMDDEDDLPFVSGTMNVSVPAGEVLYAEFVDIDDDSDPEVQMLMTELGITSSKLQAIKLDGNNVPLVNSDNLFVVDNTVEEDIPEGVTLYVLMVKADAAHTIEGIFTTDTTQPVGYTVSVVSADSTMGTVSGSGTYLLGDTIIISATAKSGYQFKEWSDASVENPRTVVVTGNLSFVAFFEPVDGIDDVDFVSSITLYPNPATVSTTLAGVPDGATVTLVDLNGRTVATMSNVTGGDLTLDLGNLASGTYFVRVAFGGQSAVRKLMVH